MLGIAFVYTFFDVETFFNASIFNFVYISFTKIFGKIGRNQRMISIHKEEQNSFEFPLYLT